MAISIVSEIESRFLSDKGIIKNEFVFNDNYEPDVFYHRDKEIKELTNFFSSIKEGVKDNIDLYGITGTGKTIIVKEIIKVFKNRFNDIKIIYINCAEYNTKTKILNKIAQKLMDKRLEGKSIDIIKNLLENFKSLIIVLDEVDKVLLNDGNELLYILSNTPKISLVNISNVPSWRNLLTDDRVRSRMPPNPIIFEGYSEEELFDILEYRAIKGLNKGSYSRDILIKIAINIGTKSNNAREAIKMLQRAAKHSEGMERSTIEIDSLEFASKKSEYDTVIEFINKLPYIRKICLASVYLYYKQNKEFPNSEQVTDSYNKLISNKGFNILTHHTMRNYLNELSTYGLLECIGGKGLGRKKGKTPFTYKINIDFNIFEREFYNKIIVYKEKSFFK